MYGRHMTASGPGSLAPRLTVLETDGSLCLRTVRLPAELAAGEVLVALDWATICTSDLHTIQGRRSQPTPSPLGHEGAGTVLGSAHPDWNPGDRVTWSVYANCGECRACTSHGLPQKCDDLFKYGHERLQHADDLSGTLATHMLLRPGTHIVAVPDSLRSDLAAIANCAVATIVETARYLPAGADRVLIQGAGLLGLLLTAYLSEQGVREVLVADTVPARVERAAEFGGTAAPADVTGADAVIELAGSPEVVPAGIEALRIGGTYVLAGMVHAQSRFSLLGMDVIRKQLSIHGVHNYTPGSLDEAVSFLTRAADRFPIANLLSEPWPLSRVAEAAQSTGSYRILIDTRA